jgi:hypothetical protein
MTGRTLILDGDSEIATNFAGEKITDFCMTGHAGGSFGLRIEVDRMPPAFPQQSTPVGEQMPDKISAFHFFA